MDASLNKPEKIKLDFKDSKYATGRRKKSIARVWVKKGSGKIYVNGKSYETYFKRENHKMQILKPFEIIDGCDYLVQGNIEYFKYGAVVATVDFGDGECDNIATKTVDGVDHEIKLNKKGKRPKKGKKPKKQVVFKLILYIFIIF